MINNNAQALSDRSNAEQKAIKNEEALARLTEDGGTLTLGDYKARVSGGSHSPWALEQSFEEGQLQPQSYISLIIEPPNLTKCTKNEGSLDSQVAAPTSKSSWMQRLQEILYEDLITAH